MFNIRIFGKKTKNKNKKQENGRGEEKCQVNQYWTNRSIKEEWKTSIV